MLAADLKDDPPNTSQAELSVTPIPDGADTEVDGAFMRNAPSTLELSPGDHVIMLKNRYRGNDCLEMSAQVIVAQPLDRRHRPAPGPALPRRIDKESAGSRSSHIR